jgi:hypothetical protein
VRVCESVLESVTVSAREFLREHELRVSESARECVRVYGSV